MLSLRQILNWLQDQGGSANLEELEQAFGVGRGLLLQMLETLVGQGRLQKESWQHSCSMVTTPGSSAPCRGCPLRSFCASGSSSSTWGTIYRLPAPPGPFVAAAVVAKRPTDRPKFDKNI